MTTLHGALQTMMRLLAAAMGMAYFVAGLFLILFPADPFGLGMTLRVALGVLLMVYGFYRLIRGTRKTTGYEAARHE